MLKKTNPLSFKLGNMQVWNSTLNSYNKPVCIYKWNRSWLLFENYVSRLKHSNKSTSFNWSFRDQNTLIIKYVSSELIDYVLLSKSKLWFQIFTETHAFKQSNINAISTLNINMLFQTNSHTKKALQDLTKKVGSLLYGKKVVFGIKGLVDLVLVGYRIKYGGCFDKSRNKMSQVVYMKKGKNSFSSLYYFVEYRYLSIHTRWGVIGVHIWLFFKCRC